MNKLFFILFFINTLFSFSQDTLKVSDNEEDMFYEIKNSLQTKPKFFFKQANKNSFISNRRGLFLSFQLGLDYDNTFRIGMGYNTLYGRKYQNYIGSILKSTETLNFDYLSTFVEYIFNKNKRYEFSLPIQLGFGYSWLGNFIRSDTKHFQMLYETQLNGMYYVFPFLGLGAGMGYRIMLVNNPYINEEFTAPIYNFKVKIVFSKIVEWYGRK